MPPEPVAIAPRLLTAVASHARTSFPDECCGYLVGARDGREVDELVACHNASDKPDEYAIDGSELIAFARTFASPRPARVVYHSHANGRAYFSHVDRMHALAGADEPAYPVQHLVIGVSAGACTEAALFVWDRIARQFVEVARFPAEMLR
jgi:proteasome lid subunit RPN8/RPN11